MDEYNFWTGLAEFTTDDLPSHSIGIIARVVTFAKDYDAFYKKVEQINSQMGGVLNNIEESFRVPDFLKQQLIKDHEIHEMFEQAKKSPNNVVYGKFHNYRHDDCE